MRYFQVAYQRVRRRWQQGAQEPLVAVGLALALAVMLGIYIAFLIVTHRLPAA